MSLILSLVALIGPGLFFVALPPLPIAAEGSSVYFDYSTGNLGFRGSSIGGNS